MDMTHWPKDAINAYMRELARVRHCYVALRLISKCDEPKCTGCTVVALDVLKSLEEWPK